MRATSATIFGFFVVQWTALSEAWAPPQEKIHRRTFLCSNSGASTTAQESSKIEPWMENLKELCKERNIDFGKVKNARDLASVNSSPVLKGRIFRMGRVGDATDSDINVLMSGLGMKTLIDLRSPTELKDDNKVLRDAVFGSFTDVVWTEQGRRKDGCLRELKRGEGPVKSNSFWKKFIRKDNARDVVDAMLTEDNDTIIKVLQEVETAESSEDGDCGYDESCGEEEDAASFPYKSSSFEGSRKERHFVSLMNEFKYVKGTVSKVRKRDITKAILKSPGALVSKRVRDSLKKPFLDEINDGGLPMLNELLLRFGAPGIKYVLEVCADKKRHPVAFYCTAGKDRTGMVAALILALCGCDAEDIVEDYSLSANVYAEMNDHQAMVGALSQRNLDPKTFLGAPPEVMRDTLKAINEVYGGVEEYCDEIGFSRTMQQKLREACMED